MRWAAFMLSLAALTGFAWAQIPTLPLPSAPGSGGVTAACPAMQLIAVPQVLTAVPMITC
jgi:hypothetical protein